MPSVKGQSKADIAALKLKFLDYYREVPIQKYAAQWIRRDENTISLWKADDADFRDAIKEMEALFVSKNLMRTKSEFRLERLLKESFGNNLDITTGGKELSGLTIVTHGDTPQQVADPGPERPI
jgi:hypothetical protein